MVSRKRGRLFWVDMHRFSMSRVKQSRCLCRNLWQLAWIWPRSRPGSQKTLKALSGRRSPTAVPAAAPVPFSARSATASILLMRGPMPRERGGRAGMPAASASSPTTPQATIPAISRTSATETGSCTSSSTTVTSLVRPSVLVAADASGIAPWGSISRRSWRRFKNNKSTTKTRRAQRKDERHNSGQSGSKAKTVWHMLLS